MGAKISLNGRSEAVAWCWHVTRNSLKGESLNQYIKCENVEIERSVLSKEVYCNSNV